MISGFAIALGVMAVFFAAAFIWSIWRVKNAGKRWRFVHLANVILMIFAMLAVYFDRIGLSMLAGIGILLLSLAIMTMDKSRSRWVGFILLVGGILLASGVPFATS